MSRKADLINKISKMLGEFKEDLVECIMESMVLFVINHKESNLINHKLTLEDLFIRDGQPVWVEPLNEKKKYSDVTGYGVVDTESDKVVRMPGIECFWWSFEDYGKTWVAYDSEPLDFGEDGDENE